MTPRAEEYVAIALAGHISSGKSSLARALSSVFRWDIVSFGSYVRAEAEHRGLSDGRRTLQDLGDNLLRTLGPSALLADAVRVSNPQSHVFLVDGVRHPSMMTAIRSQHTDSVLLFIDTLPDIRYSRYCRRYGADPSLHSCEYRELCEHPIELGIDLLKPAADVVLDGSLPAEEVVRRASDALVRLGVA